MSGEVLAVQDGVALVFEAGQYEGDQLLTVGNMTADLIVLEHVQVGDAVNQRLGLVIKPQNSANFWFRNSTSIPRDDVTDLTVRYLRNGESQELAARVIFGRSQGGWWSVSQVGYA